MVVLVTVFFAYRWQKPNVIYLRQIGELIIHRLDCLTQPKVGNLISNKTRDLGNVWSGTFHLKKNLVSSKCDQATG
jgi:hypothetical protein